MSSESLVGELEQVVETFENLPEWKVIDSLPLESVRRIVVDRAYVSLLGFTSFYDLVACKSDDEDLTEIIRDLIRAEYPEGKSHRELLISDLQRMGISKEYVFDRDMPEPSRRTVDDMHSFARYTVIDYPIYAGALLLAGGEALVGAEYQQLMPSLERLGLHPSESVFFVPHIVEDNIRENGNHTTQLKDYLHTRVHTDSAFYAYTLGLSKGFELRSRFYRNHPFIVQARAVQQNV